MRLMLARRATAPPPTPARASWAGSARTARGACACPAASTAPARSPSSAAATRATPDSTATSVRFLSALNLRVHNSSITFLSAVCREGCVHGTCKEPGECTCHPGWTGEDCSECVPLPDCQNGFCEKPLECRCRPGYEGQGPMINERTPLLCPPVFYGWLWSSLDRVDVV